MVLPSCHTGLYVDDIRDLPSDYNPDLWTVSRTPWNSLELLDTREYNIVSLDHDLAGFVGNKEITGWDILVWLVERKQNNLYVPSKVLVHSANPVGIQKMTETINKYW